MVPVSASLALTLLLLTPSTVQKQFVQVVRAVEFSLGINSGFVLDIDINISLNLTSILSDICEDIALEAEVASALRDAVPVLTKMADEYGDLSVFSGWSREGRNPLTTT